MNRAKPFHIHIEAGESPMTLNLREVWRYRDLILLFTKKNFNLIYKQTILGPLWVVLSPLLTSIVYTVVFGEMAGLSTGGVPKLLFYLCSHSLWGFFAECLNRNAETFITNAGVFGKVYFPRLTVPLATMLFAAVQFAIQFAMVAVLIVFYLIRGEVTPSFGLLPLVIPTIAVTGMMGLSVGILISSVTTKYRDLQLLVRFGVQLWMYASPVIYPIAQMNGGFWYRLLLINPMTAPMELFRLSVLGTGSVPAVSVVSTAVFAGVMIPVSILVFNRVERHFIDTV